MWFSLKTADFMQHWGKLSKSFSGALRKFSYWIANGTVGYPLMEGVDYLDIFGEEPSAIEQVYAIFANVIELDESGNVMNADYAQRRAAQYLRSYCDSSYFVDPPFEYWELELHD